MAAVSTDYIDRCIFEDRLEELLREFGDDEYHPANLMDDSKVLHRACHYGNERMCRILLEQYGADVHAEDNRGRTPLWTAANQNHLEVVKLLVEDFGAFDDINVTDKRERTPQQIAQRKSHTAVEEYLKRLLEQQPQLLNESVNQLRPQLSNESVDELLWSLRLLYPKCRHDTHMIEEVVDKVGIDTETIEAYLNNQWEDLIAEWDEVCCCSEELQNYILGDLSRRWKLDKTLIHNVFMGEELQLRDAVTVYLNGYAPACVHDRVWERSIAFHLPDGDVVRSRFLGVKGTKTIEEGSGDLKQESLRALIVSGNVFNTPGVGSGAASKEHSSTQDSRGLELLNDGASVTTYDPDPSFNEYEWTFDGTMCTSDLSLREDGSLVVFWDNVRSTKRGYSLARGTRALKKDSTALNVWKLAVRTKGSTRTEVGLVGDDFDISAVEGNFDSHVLGVQPNSVGVRILPGSGEFLLEVWEANECLEWGKFVSADQGKSTKKEVQLELKYGPNRELSVFLDGVQVIEPTQTNLGSEGRRVYPAAGSKTKNATVKLLGARECPVKKTKSKQEVPSESTVEKSSESSVLQTVQYQAELMWSLLGCYFGQSSSMSQQELTKADALLGSIFQNVYAICLKVPLEDGSSLRDRLADQCFSTALDVWLNRTGESLLVNNRSAKQATKLPLERLRDSNPKLCKEVIGKQVSDLFELREKDDEADIAFKKLEQICGFSANDVDSLKSCMCSMIPSVNSGGTAAVHLWEESWNQFLDVHKCCVLDSRSLRQLRSEGYPESILLSILSCLGAGEELNEYANEFVEEYIQTHSGGNSHSILASFAAARVLLVQDEKSHAACVLMKLFLLLLCGFQIDQMDGQESKISSDCVSLSNIFSEDEFDKFYHFERNFEKVQTGASDMASEFHGIEASPPEEQWRNLRDKYPDEECEAMDELMKLVGLEEVKKHALQIFTTTKASQSLEETSRVPMTLNFTFVGNPGTGKTTVGRIFGDLLFQVGAREQGSVLPNGRKKGLFKETTATKLKREGGGKFDELVQEALGGVLFIDEAYQLDPLNDDSGVGKSIVDELLVTAENYRNKLTIILAGYKDEIESKLYSYNTGMVSRFQEVTFHDFSDKHLRTIWQRFLSTYQWNVSDSGEDSSRDITGVAVRRVSRHRGQKGFGNAREVRNAMEAAFKRATSRQDLDPSNPTLRLEDVLGPKPSRDTIPELDQALTDLGELPGLEKVKKSIDDLVKLVAENYQRELRGRNTQEVALNRLFVGNYGTSKEEVARIYSRVLKSLSLISKGGLELKTARDFIGNDEVTTKKNTQEIIELHKGKTILINEANCLNDHDLGKHALNVLADKLGSNTGEDLAVVFSGYERELRDMLHQQTPALRRRFDLANAFYFHDHNRRTLAKIFRTICSKNGVDLPFKVLEDAVERLETRRCMGNFGNTAAVRNLFFSAMRRMNTRGKETGTQIRQLCVKDVLGVEDDSPGTIDPIKALRDVTMSEKTVSRAEEACRNNLSTYQSRLQETRSVHFVFKGDRGSGKRTVARCLAMLLNQKGFVRNDDVVEVSAFDLCGSVAGEADELVRTQCRLAKSRTLFIDEAQHFEASPYGSEALDTLKQVLDHPWEFAGGDLPLIILTGLPEETESLLSNNPGLKEYFQSELDFPSWNAQEAKDYVVGRAREDGFGVEGDAISLLQQSFERLRGRPTWSHARDATNAYEHQIMPAKWQRAYDPGDKSAQKLTYDDVSAGMAAMLRERPPEGEESTV